MCMCIRVCVCSVIYMSMTPTLVGLQCVLQCVLQSVAVCCSREGVLEYIVYVCVHLCVCSCVYIFVCVCVCVACTHVIMAASPVGLQCVLQ